MVQYSEYMHHKQKKVFLLSLNIVLMDIQGFFAFSKLFSKVTWNHS